MTTGEKIKQVRKQKKISQQILGKSLGVSQAMIAQYENGSRLPKIETLRRIAAALEVPLYEISDWSQYSAEDLRRDFIGGVDELTRPAQDMVNNLLDGANDLARSAMETRNQLLKDIPRTREEAEKYKETLLLEQFYQLNPEGQTAAVETVENLTYNPKYFKEKEYFAESAEK